MAYRGKGLPSAYTAVICVQHVFEGLFIDNYICTEDTDCSKNTNSPKTSDNARNYI